MNSSIASLIFACGIAGLFYLDREKVSRISRAVWLPVIYLWINGSRPVSSWLNITPANGGNMQLDGSPLDAAIFGILLLAAISVLARRQKKTAKLLAANWPILLYFFVCLVSVAWSFHPDVAFKRWFKSLSDLAMGLIIVTDRDPFSALKQLFSRVGFVLLPCSLLLIKYFGNLGRQYTPDGLMVNTGVTTNKNTLGVVLLVICLGTLWHFITIWRDKELPDRKRHLWAQGVLLAFGLLLLKMADSATSLACFGLGGGLIVITQHRALRGRAARVNVICLCLVCAGALMFFFTGQGNVAGALGRNSNLSGRTEIWAALLPTVPNAIIGAGFESYWISPSAQKLWDALALAGWWHPEILVPEAHNGYIEIYLNLGWIGVCLIATILATGYRRAINAFRLNPSLGSLMLAYSVASAVYSITEAGFRSLDPIWDFLILANLFTAGIVLGLIGEPGVRKVVPAMEEPVRHTKHAAEPGGAGEQQAAIPKRVWTTSLIRP